VANNQPKHITVDKLDDDDLSDLSEDDDNLHPEQENEKDIKLIQLELKPTNNPRIKQLFSNTDKVNVSVDEYK